MVFLLAQKQYLQAVTNGVIEIGRILDQYYVKLTVNDQNELPNEPIILN